MSWKWRLWGRWWSVFFRLWVINLIEVPHDRGSHTLPAGPGGRAGSSGLYATNALINGKDGPAGTVNIFIEDREGQIKGPFFSQYKLEVIDFSIVDGNGDGVLEFGEEIIVKDIRICNRGCSSSSSNN